MNNEKENVCNMHLRAKISIYRSKETNKLYAHVYGIDNDLIDTGGEHKDFEITEEKVKKIKELIYRR